MALPKLRILCFGDSLTSGYSMNGLAYHPYNERLEEKIHEAFPDVQIEITADGLPGDVTTNFAGRISKYFERDQGPKPYDWTIILGGTNDLAYNFEAATIFANLEKAWNVALLRRSKVLVLTVPEAGVTTPAVRERLDARRDRLNSMIKGVKRANFYHFDLHEAVPYFSMSPKDNELYWDDLIHLTSDGYDLMGEKIADALLLVLHREGVNGRKKRVFKDDNISFDEETGDPSCLGQGYVVVRRKDLD